MTLPPNCLPPENAALPGDLLAVLGQPVSAPADGQPAAPFADLLAGAGTPTITCTPPQPAPAAPVAPVVPSTPSPVLYSSHCYTTLLQPATLEEAPVSPDEPTPENISPDVEPVPEDEGALLVAFQLIAGQWVPQPVVTPTTLPPPESDAPLSIDPGLGRGGKARPEFAAVQRDNRISNEGPGDAAQTKTVLPAAELAEKTATPPTNNRPDTKQSAAQPVDAVTGMKSDLPLDKMVPQTANTRPAIPLPPSDQTVVKLAPEPATPSAQNPTALPTNATPPNTSPDTALAQSQRLPSATPVKFAAPDSAVRAEIASGVNPPNQPQEKKTLVADAKNVKSTGRQVGTSVANREYSMPYSAVNKSSDPAVTALPQPFSAGGMRTDTKPSTVETSTASAVHAPRLVQEIHAIADRLSSIDRNTVEVRFDFNEADRLSVRVEYRDGTVHTTFRTDSDTLRDAIAREWTSQATAETRAYRVAEPTFSTNSPTASADLSQTGQHSDQSHGRAFEQPAAPGNPGHVHHGRSFNASTSNASAPAPGVRPETSHHLHTFA